MNAFQVQFATRRFIRHPTAIPVDLRLEDTGTSPETDPMLNVSIQGLSFLTHQALPLGRWLWVSIPVVRPPFETRARIVWSQPRDDKFEVGVELASAEDAYRARMVEQICHIEHYRHEVLAEQGRELSPEQAAAEWIEKFAALFPSFDDE